MPDERPITETPIVPIDVLYAEYNDLRKDLFEIADQLPDGGDFKATLLESDKKIQDLISGREAKILECHPNGEHWPPHDDCPLCQKVAAKWDKVARDRCKELGLEETEENLEIALKDYIQKRV